MKNTLISAILIAVTANSASAQNTPSFPYQPGQLIGAYKGYQLHQPKVVPNNHQQSTLALPRTAPAPAPSIPFQPHELTTPLSSLVAQPVAPIGKSVLKTMKSQERVGEQLTLSSKAPAPSIPAQSDEFTTPLSSLVAQPVNQEVENNLNTAESQEVTGELLALPNESPSQTIIESSKETAAPTETVVVASEQEIKPASELEMEDMAGELVVTPTPNDVEESIELTTETEPSMLGLSLDADSNEPVVATTSSATADEPSSDLATETEPSMLGSSIDTDTAEPVVAATSTATTDESSSDLTKETEPSMLGSSIDTDTAEPVIAATPSATADESSNEVAEHVVTNYANEPISSVAVVPQRITSTPKRTAGKEKLSVKTASTESQNSFSYVSWLLGLVTMLAVPRVVWLVVRKRRQNAKVNKFAERALSRVNAGMPQPKKSRVATDSQTLSEKTKSAQDVSVSAAKSVNANEVKVKRGAVATSAKKTSTTAEDFTVKSNDSVETGDDFTLIPQVDAEIKDLLHQAGYLRFSDLEKASEREIKLALSKNGDSFSRLDFSSWSSLAGLASRGDWSAFQSQLTATVATSQSTVANSEKPVDASISQADELTKIRGIGPETAELLRAAGVTTFQALIDAGTTRLQEILDAGGAKFERIDPSMWCRQAQFLTSGTWVQPNVVESATGKAEVTVSKPEYRIPEKTMDFSAANEIVETESNVDQAEVMVSKPEYRIPEKTMDFSAANEIVETEQNVDRPVAGQPTITITTPEYRLPEATKALPAANEIVETEPNVDQSVVGQPKATVTTPEYRVPEATKATATTPEYRVPEATIESPAANETSGLFSKGEVERFEQLASMAGQSDDEAALLEQIKSIRAIVGSTTDNVSQEGSTAESTETVKK